VQAKIEEAVNRDTGNPNCGYVIRSPAQTAWRTQILPRPENHRSGKPNTSGQTNQSTAGD
jgi:hypothetical protein